LIDEEMPKKGSIDITFFIKTSVPIVCI
jgi:hypothetical protein